MVTTKQILNKGEAKIVAHRGISGIEPENTLSAFIAAGLYMTTTNVLKIQKG